MGKTENLYNKYETVRLHMTIKIKYKATYENISLYQ